MKSIRKASPPLVASPHLPPFRNELTTQTRNLEATGGRDSRPVLWLAAIGTLFIAVQVYVYASWIVSGDATPTAPGVDPVPTFTKVWAWLFQAIAVVAVVGVAIYCVRQSRREGRLAFDAMLAIAWASVYWQDTGMNYLRPIFLYNSYLINLGAWNPHMPGWISPYAGLLPEPLLLIAPTYIVLGVLFSVTFSAVARRAKARWPGLGNVTLGLLGLSVLMFLDLVLELAFIRTNLYAYSGTVHELSIAGGSRYQFPLYEPFLAGGLFGACGALRFFRDDKGRSFAERGISHVRVSTRTRIAISALAIIAFVNLGFLGYNVTMNWIGLYVDETPRYPSYLLNGLCGQEKGYRCPSPNAPILLPGSISNSSP